MIGELVLCPAVRLLLSLEQAGLAQFKLGDNNGVLVSPAGALSDEQRAVLQRYRVDVRLFLALTHDEGVAFRRDVFRRQLEACVAPAAPPFVLVDGITYARGHCFSCGDRLPTAQQLGRCWRCSVAWRLAAGVDVPDALATAILKAESTAVRSHR